MTTSGQDWDTAGPERLYVITGGRSQSGEQAALDLVTLIVTREESQLGMQPELAAILRICRSPLSVAEISAHLALPASVVGVLLNDLLADGRVEARAPAAKLPDIALIEAVIDGLQKL
ncbi:DUF742 domain-containing protein [Streptomyces tubercidicus]|uniref:DUF742 domain-containing protein n=1 Tax=Streptomyces TaxID=1883 RepID=UPI001F2A73D2|nr:MULTISPECIES: DUF742 domain-containing protein [Streptomyces]MCF3143359.1 DUF742 domain-containing protein [Streptomyces platensis]WAU10056.1 DUF742 domain-containing protein [Streptomyces tubercidicus]